MEAMRTSNERTRSAFSSACSYVAIWLCAAALALLGYQVLLWLRHGAWVPHQMWVVLSWTGWERPPSIWWGLGQPTLDHIWALIGNCPITIALCALSIVAAVIGFLGNSSRLETGSLRGAH
jgi:hypothetical protein